MSVIRKVPLTDDQFDRLYDASEQITLIGEVLGQAIVAATGESAKLRRRFWESVKLTAGGVEGEKLKVDWISRQIIVSEHDADDDK